MSVELSGYSDDILCVSGDIDAEFGVYDIEAGLVSFSDGTLVVWCYDYDGMWRFKVAYSNSPYSLVKGTDIDTDYTDRLTIDAAIDFVVVAAFDGDDVRIVDSAVRS